MSLESFSNYVKLGLASAALFLSLGMQPASAQHRPEPGHYLTKDGTSCIVMYTTPKGDKDFARELQSEQRRIMEAEGVERAILYQKAMLKSKGDISLTCYDNKADVDTDSVNGKLASYTEAKRGPVIVVSKEKYNDFQSAGISKGFISRKSPKVRSLQKRHNELVDRVVRPGNILDKLLEGPFLPDIK
jgi:hypothetical protein